MPQGVSDSANFVRPLAQPNFIHDVDRVPRRPQMAVDAGLPAGAWLLFAARRPELSAAGSAFGRLDEGFRWHGVRTVAGSVED